MNDPPQRLHDIFRELQRWLETMPVPDMDVDMSGTTLTVALVLNLPDPDAAADAPPVYAHLKEEEKGRKGERKKGEISIGGDGRAVS